MATIIFKPTEACNARCVYCDVVHKNSPAVKTMSPEALEMFFIRLNEYLLECPSDNMEIIWHGGEPLLLGPGFFELALELQRKHCSKTAHNIRHAMQSNLILFSKKFTDILCQLGINSIGTSYDPFSPLRGLGSTVDAEAYNRRFIEGVRLLEKEGFEWGLIYVVTKLSLNRPLEIFHHLTNFCPDGSIMLNPVTIYDNKLEHLRITPEEFADFLGDIFPVWWSNRHRYPLVEPFYPLMRNLANGERSLSCCDSGNCAVTHINLAPDGRLSQCGRSSDWGLLDYGSIYDKTFAQVLADPQREQLIKRNQILYEGECKECRFWDICHGGCPLDAWYKAGSFMHKSAWCQAKRGFIEKYFEPIVNNGSGKKPLSCEGQNIYHTEEKQKSRSERPKPKKLKSRKTETGLPWINPVGGLGDTLMISGVLKQVVEKDPAWKFNLVARTKYGPILRGHPAIANIGHPPHGATFIGMNYWDEEDYGSGQRAYQILARMFGLRTPVEERLYVPWDFEEDPVIVDFIPWKEKNVLICPTSDSPRKQMRIGKWETLIERLQSDGMMIVQAGIISDPYIRGTYNLRGLTTPRQIVSMLRRFDAVVTLDNFIMHAAYLCSVPAVVLWGPTDHHIYGYQGQDHLQAIPSCPLPAGCIGPRRGHLYATPCTESHDHCMDQLNVEDIYQSVRKILNE